MAAGKGERLHSITQEIPKALINIAGKTLLEWSIKRLSDAGCSEIFVGTGWKGEMISNAVGQADDIDVPIHFVPVPEYESGPLHTFYGTLKHVHGSTNVLLPVDLIVSSQDVKSIIDVHPTCEHYAVTLAIDDSAESGSDVFINENGRILAINKEVTVQCKKTTSAILLVFSPGLLDYCKYFLHRGEGRIFNVLNDMVWMVPLFHKDKPPIHSYQVKSEWFDIDTIHDILRANRYLLKNLVTEKPQGIYVPLNDTMAFGDDITLGTNISIGSGVELKGPCLIQDNSRIEENCVIGPNVSLDENTQIESDSILEEAVVFGSSSISENQRLSHVVVFKSNIIREDV